MPGVKWTQDQLDEFQKRGGKVDGDTARKPQQGKPLIEVLFPEASAGRSSRGEGVSLNKTEAAFKLWLEQRTGYTVFSQSIRLRLAKKTWYLPDFVVLDLQGNVMVYEVKGFMRDDAAVKLKVAAEIYRRFDFFLVTKKKGGTWDIKPIEP